MDVSVYPKKHALNVIQHGRSWREYKYTEKIISVYIVDELQISDKVELMEANNCVIWLEQSVDQEHINCYEYLDFKNIQTVASGSFGCVVRATWKNTDTVFALKSFNNNKVTLKEVIKEV